MTDKGLSAELRDVESKHPRWHAFRSSSGRCWAVTVHVPGRSGYTVDAPTPALLDHEIAVTEHQWAGERLSRGAA